jgi:hypothetical protein
MRSGGTAQQRHRVPTLDRLAFYSNTPHIYTDVLHTYLHYNMLYIEYRSFSLAFFRFKNSTTAIHST